MKLFLNREISERPSPSDKELKDVEKVGGLVIVVADSGGGWCGHC